MEIEILLDVEEALPENMPAIEQRIQQWYAEGAEVRYDKLCFGSLTPLKSPYNFRVDLRQVDCITAIQDLHVRLYRFGVKVFVHFLH